MHWSDPALTYPSGIKGNSAAPDAVDTGIQSGEVIDDYSIYEDYDSMWQDDVKADNDFGYSAHADTSANIPANVKFYDKFSQLYVSGLEAAKEFR